MNPGRRIAAALLATAMCVGTVGLTAGPADADTSWPTTIVTSK